MSVGAARSILVRSLRAAQPPTLRAMASTSAPSKPVVIPQVCQMGVWTSAETVKDFNAQLYTPLKDADPEVSFEQYRRSLPRRLTERCSCVCRRSMKLTLVVDRRPDLEGDLAPVQRVRGLDSLNFALILASLELIASENLTSYAVNEANGSILTNKYSEGLPGARCP